MIPSQCDGNPCCENGPNPLCCVNGGVCSDTNFTFNGTNADECQCTCDDNFTGNFEFSVLDFESMIQLMNCYCKMLNVQRICVKMSLAQMDFVSLEFVTVILVTSK